MIDKIKGLETVRFEADTTFTTVATGRQKHCRHHRVEIKVETTEDARVQPVLVCWLCDMVWRPVSANENDMEMIRRGFLLQPVDPVVGQPGWRHSIGVPEKF